LTFFSIPAASLVTSCLHSSPPITKSAQLSQKTATSERAEKRDSRTQDGLSETKQALRVSPDIYYSLERTHLHQRRACHSYIPSTMTSPLRIYMIATDGGFRASWVTSGYVAARSCSQSLQTLVLLFPRTSRRYGLGSSPVREGPCYPMNSAHISKSVLDTTVRHRFFDQGTQARRQGVAARHSDPNNLARSII
jgi:hypothetical protein